MPKPILTRIVYGLISCLLLGVGVLRAQSNEPALFEEAEKLFSEKNYYEAAQAYEKYLTGDKDSKRISSSPFAVRKKGGSQSVEGSVARQGAVYRLAESYRLHNDYKQAEKWYKEAASYSLSSYPASQYWYGVTLRTNQKYDEAIKVITEFRESRKEKDEWTLAADRELENLRYIRGQSDATKKMFTVTRKPNAANTSAYALATSPAKEVFFTAMFVDSSKMYQGYPAYSARLYSAPDSGNIRETAKLVNIPEEPGYNNGLPSVTNDGQQLFFTRWQKNEGVITAAIYTSRKNADGSWSVAKKLSSPVNLEGSNSTQPFITPDGKYLLFSSDRQGGFGKYDIWFAKLNADREAVSAQNMGIFINTPNDEATPWYHPATNSLVFSSNGHIGMGGFDIYASKGDIETAKWEVPVNPGEPVNSTKDDQYYVGTDDVNLWNTGWLSSDRETDCCLDLFAVVSDNVQYISGKVVDKKTGEPLKNVSLFIRDPKKNDSTMLSLETDSLGFYQFELRNTSRYSIVAQKPSYNNDTSSYTVAIVTGRDSIKNKDLALSSDEIFDPDVGEPPDPKDEIFKPDKGKDPPERPPGDGYDAASRPMLIARFEFDKSLLQKKYYHNLDTLIKIMEKNPSLKVEVGGHTDAFGTEEYNLQLAQDRVDACISYLRDRGINTERLIARSYGESSPVVREIVDGSDSPEGRAMNRRVEFRILQGAASNTVAPVITEGLNERQAGEERITPDGTAKQSKSGRTARTRKTVDGQFQPVVHFAFDKSVVDDEYFNNLDRLAELMNQDPSMKVEVNGYTDAKGSAAYNLELAQERVDAVIIYLEQQGISRTRLSGRAFGECCPLEAETINGRDNPDGRFMNRRVEFKFIQ